MSEYNPQDQEPRQHQPGGIYPDPERSHPEPAHKAPSLKTHKTRWISLIFLALVLLGLYFYETGPKTDSQPYHELAESALTPTLDESPAAPAPESSSANAPMPTLDTQSNPIALTAPAPEPSLSPATPLVENTLTTPPTETKNTTEPVPDAANLAAETTKATETDSTLTLVQKAPAAAKTKTPPVKKTPAPTQSTPAKKAVAHSGPGFTLQLMSSANQPALQKYIKEHKLGSQVQIRKTLRGSTPWYLLTYGHYSNSTQAHQALKTLPANLRQLHPWVRPVK